MKESPDLNERIICLNCSVELEPNNAALKYLGGSFHADLLTCPKCGYVYVPEELALGKMFEVEQELEDK